MAYYRYSIVDYVDKDFETYVQGRGKLSRHCTSRSKIESIDTETRMTQGRGNRELVEELRKKKTKKIDKLLTIFEKSGSRVLDCFYERSWPR